VEGIKKKKTWTRKNQRAAGRDSDARSERVVLTKGAEREQWGSVAGKFSTRPSKRGKLTVFRKVDEVENQNPPGSLFGPFRKRGVGEEPLKKG